MLLLAAMAVFVVLMMTKKLATPLALMALAVIIGIILGIPWIGKPDDSILGGIVASGATALAATIVAVVFGSWLGAVMDETGIAQTLVRKAVELGWRSSVRGRVRGLVRRDLRRHGDRKRARGNPRRIDRHSGDACGRRSTHGRRLDRRRRPCGAAIRCNCKPGNISRKRWACRKPTWSDS